MHRLVPAFALLLASATLAQAEMITRTHADGSTSVIVPAPYVGPPAPLTRAGAWPFFPYQTELWRLRAAARAEQGAQAAEIERLRTPPPSSLAQRQNTDSSHALQVLQTAPSMASDLDEGSRKRTLRLERADKAYAESLARVKQDPSCTDCRQEALDLGRQRAALNRPEGKATIYDEAAIANDLNAVSGSAGGR